MAEIDEEYAEIIAEVGPRRRDLIVAAAEQVAADVQADATLLGTAAITRQNRRQLRILGDMPAQTFRQSQFWRHQFAAAAQRLGEDARRWGAPIPRCSGEEMALHFILRRAAVDDTDLPAERACDWPDEQNPHGWGDLYEYLFQDHDVLLLFDMPSDAAESVIDTVNLHPDRWFSEFGLPFTVPERTT
ncbi:hypothetical protein ACNQR7_32265 [Mycolicibacterium senegalense]|uniref:hypothetical protein n=1 Tax=Mycobacteriaceae TaxID=1762 RepID=UPI003AAE50C5